MRTGRAGAIGAGRGMRTAAAAVVPAVMPRAAGLAVGAPGVVGRIPGAVTGAREGGTVATTFVALAALRGLGWIELAGCWPGETFVAGRVVVGLATATAEGARAGAFPTALCPVAAVLPLAVVEPTRDDV